MGRSSRLFRGMCALLAIVSAASSATGRDVHPARAESNGAVTGYVWYDDNASGAADTGELRVAGLTVIALWAPPSTTTTQTVTDVNGSYTLSLPPGSYTLTASTTQKPGVALPGGARYAGATQITVAAGVSVTANIGLQPRGQNVAAKIEVVWPHGPAGDPQPVDRAPLINASAMLFVEGSNASVPCDFSGTVRLWQSLNNTAARSVALGLRRIATETGKTFPVWDFENINVEGARDPLNKYYFFLTVESGGPFPYQSSTNVWAHGADARTYYPTQDLPPSVSSTPGEVESRIQVVWPHDGAGNSRSVAQASFVNITTAIFQRGTLVSIPPDWNPTVRLYQSLNAGAGTLVAQGARRTITTGSLTYPVWDFNNIPVDQATNPANKYFFAVLVEGAATYPAIWSHGADGRTYFPRKDVPDNSCP